MEAMRLVAVALALTLAGCVQVTATKTDVPPSRKPATLAKDKFSPRVWVDRGEIRIDQEVIRFGKHEKRVVITWKLDQSNPETRDYVFPQEGIRFEPPGNADFTGCGPKANGRHYSCTNENPGRNWYKYVVTVTSPSFTPIPLDPFVVND